jgi:hypothetical protein
MADSDFFAPSKSGNESLGVFSNRANRHQPGDIYRDSRSLFLGTLCRARISQSVMNIDDSVRKRRNKLLGKDLHVAR